MKNAISTDIDKLKNLFNIDLQSASVNENGDLIKAVSTEKTHHLSGRDKSSTNSCYSSSMHINSNTSERAIMIMVPCKGITTRNEHWPTIDIYHCTNHQVSPCVIIGRIAVVVTIVVDIAFHIICDWNWQIFTIWLWLIRAWKLWSFQQFLKRSPPAKFFLMVKCR